MKFIYNDGGRNAAGFKGSARDCVARAVAIASQQPYQMVYKALAEGNASQRRRPGQSGTRPRTARNGISVRRKWFKDYMAGLGFTWVPTMAVGTGTTTHLCADELPGGRLVVSVSRHLIAVIDGEMHDTSDPSRNGRRCVYGYWVHTAQNLARAKSQVE